MNPERMAAFIEWVKTTDPQTWARWQKHAPHLGEPEVGCGPSVSIEGSWTAKPFEPAAKNLVNCLTCGTGSDWWIHSGGYGLICPMCEGNPLVKGSGHADWRVRQRARMQQAKDKSGHTYDWKEFTGTGGPLPTPDKPAITAFLKVAIGFCAALLLANAVMFFLNQLLDLVRNLQGR